MRRRITPRPLVPATEGDLGTQVLAHLDAQLASARGLLELVLEQGAAIRARDVHNVVRLSGLMRGALGAREILDEQRTRLLLRSGEQLGVTAEEVTLGRLSALMGPELAERAGALSAELRGLLHEIQREHATNRSLMQIELGFLDHLMGLLALDGVSGYDTRGSSTPITQPRPAGTVHVLDLHA
jgi:hypothetical protein